jgi:chemotaxis family two-component system response regulator Rcp1
MDGITTPSASLMLNSSTRRLILVLQSDETHRQLIQEMLLAFDQHPEIMAIANTHDALRFLQRQGQYATAQRPDVVLLDPTSPIV